MSASLPARNAGVAAAASEVWRAPSRRLLHLRLALWNGGLGLALLVAVGTAAVLAGAAQAAGVAVTGLALAGAALAAIERRWRAWGYLEREDDLLIRRGVLVRRLTVVPYGRMQYVDVVSGPLERRFGLASVTLHTAAAATHAHLPGLPLAEATRVRDRLAALGEARQAGL